MVESKRDKPSLLIDTFRYTQEKISNTTIYQTCANRLWPGRAIQPSMKQTHNHDGDEMKCDVKEFRRTR